MGEGAFPLAGMAAFFRRAVVLACGRRTAARHLGLGSSVEEAF